jgi:hypothetical protein
MRTNRAAIFLTVLLFWAQVDDLCFPCADLQPQTSGPSDDEYLPTVRQQELQQRSALRQPEFAGLIASILIPVSAAASVGVHRSINISQPLGPAPLYVFMSLQR